MESLTDTYIHPLPSLTPINRDSPGVSVRFVRSVADGLRFSELKSWSPHSTLSPVSTIYRVYCRAVSEILKFWPTCTPVFSYWTTNRIPINGSRMVTSSFPISKFIERTLRASLSSRTNREAWCRQSFNHKCPIPTRMKTVLASPRLQHAFKRKRACIPFGCFSVLVTGRQFQVDQGKTRDT